MKTKIRTTLLTTLFFFGLLTGLQAQTKYEYASVVCYPYAKKGSPNGVRISVSQAGKFYQVEKEVSEGAMQENLTPAIEVVNKLALEGWEVYNNNIIFVPGPAFYIYYYLRKAAN